MKKTGIAVLRVNMKRCLNEAAAKGSNGRVEFEAALTRYHSTGDPPGFCYPYMWAHGGMEVSRDGKSIQFNKPEFVEGMRKFVQAWKDGYDETGTSWDDSNNNRAFLSGQISSTVNASSIYFAAKKDNPELAKDIHHMLFPKGPAGRFYWLESRTFAILKNSKNIDGAKEFLKWWFQDKQFGDWWRLQEGYMLQPVVKYYNDPTWFKDPKMSPFREEPKYGINAGLCRASQPEGRARLVEVHRGGHLRQGSAVR